MENALVVTPYPEAWSERAWDTYRRIQVKDAKKRPNILRADAGMI